MRPGRDRALAARATCRDLSSNRNDFEVGQRDTFDLALDPHVAHGTKFTGIQLRYSTGLSLGDTWQPAELKVSLYYGSGQEELLCDGALGQTVSNGAVIAPNGCP